MAAALACIDELEATKGIERMRAIGEMLRDGMTSQARSHGFDVTYSGPPSMPFMSFKEDKGKFARNKAFCAHAARHGVYFAPMHNWFISAAHTERDIAHTLEVTDAAFTEVRRQFS